MSLVTGWPILLFWNRGQSWGRGRLLDMLCKYPGRYDTDRCELLVTILKMRTPSMPIMKMPVFTWTSLCANVLIIASFPILTVTIALLTLTDIWECTSLPMIWRQCNDVRQLDWAWGHPEVYILVLPLFGVFSEVTATFARKKLFGYTSLIWATILSQSLRLSHGYITSLRWDQAPTLMPSSA